MANALHAARRILVRTLELLAADVTAGEEQKEEEDGAHAHRHAGSKHRPLIASGALLDQRIAVAALLDYLRQRIR